VQTQDSYNIKRYQVIAYTLKNFLLMQIIPILWYSRRNPPNSINYILPTNNQNP
jgi:hypothetical protein